MEIRPGHRFTYCQNCEGWYDAFVPVPMPVVNGTRNPMPLDLAEVWNGIEAVGFRRPHNYHYKVDARGPEYGYYKVMVCDSDNIKVHRIFDNPECQIHDDPNFGCYEMVFRTIGDFKNWASDVT